MKTRIVSIAFDRNERPLRASIRTPLGTVTVVWRDVCGERCWFTSGTLDAKKLAVPAIERMSAWHRDALHIQRKENTWLITSQNSVSS